MSDVGGRRRTTPTQRIRKLFYEFAHLEASGGLLLVGCTAIALFWANSAWSPSYQELQHTIGTTAFGRFELSQSLLHWINDGLMALFFFVVGLEIKREVLAGELAYPGRAVLPIAAAIGGMLFPAAIYALVNAGRPSLRGWGVPMATDIAFSLGVLALLGSRAPLGLKVFLTALAIADDMGGVLVIAIFYAGQVAWLNLAVAGGLLVALVALNADGVRRPLPYAVLGAGVWLAFLNSGVHPTVSGILVAMTVPARSRIRGPEFVATARSLLDEFRCVGDDDRSVLASQHCQAVLQNLEGACENVETPLQRLLRALHPWVIFGVLPLFALANAGVPLGTSLAGAWRDPVPLGVAGGLVIGKPLGILLFSWLAVRTGIGALPTGVTWRHLCGAGCLAGIGFTMSIFMASLAFDATPYLPVAKGGIILASFISGLLGWLILRGAARSSEVPPDTLPVEVSEQSRPEACEACPTPPADGSPPGPD